MKKKNGQVLILVLLIVVVALAVGLSVASRNITNLRTSTQSEQSQRAFSAAEGGVESVITNPAAVAGLGPTPIPVGNLNATVVVSSNPTYLSTVEEGNVGQVDLEISPGNYYSGNVTVKWIARGSLEDVSPRASVEIAFICQSNSCFGDSGSGGYSQHRVAYRAEDISGQEGFASCNNSDPNYYCSQLFTVSSGDHVKLLRIRPFWNTVTLDVSGSPALPSQRYNITSTATTELGVTRKIQVDKTALPQLPAAFDYVLYSEGDVAK